MSRKIIQPVFGFLLPERLENDQVENAVADADAGSGQVDSSLARLRLKWIHWIALRTRREKIKPP